MKHSLGTRISVAALMFLSLLISVVGASVLRTSAFRVGSQEETAETFAVDVQLSSQRRSSHKSRAFSTLPINLRPHQAGPVLRRKLPSPSGHRLSNGLLAPLTC
jgi:hypothetical protein